MNQSNFTIDFDLFFSYHPVGATFPLRLEIERLLIIHHLQVTPNPEAPCNENDTGSTCPDESLLFDPDDHVRFTPKQLDLFVGAQSFGWNRDVRKVVIDLNVILQVMMNLQTQLYVLRMQ